MPMTLNVGISKKIGQANYGSLGASCNVQIELPANVIFDDPEAFQRQIRQAYSACTGAVTEELSRHRPDNGDPRQYRPTASNGNGRYGRNGNGSQSRSNGRKATTSQIRAIQAIADRQQVDLASELNTHFGVDRPDALSVAEASQCIDELKALAGGNGAGRG
jgi:hypothetical protein